MCPTPRQASEWGTASCNDNLTPSGGQLIAVNEPSDIRDAAMHRYRLGEPLLSVRVGDDEVTIHARESEGVVDEWMQDFASPDMLWVVTASEDVVTAGPHTGALGATLIGKQAAIYGFLPPKATTVEVTVGGEKVEPVQQAHGVFLAVASSRQVVTVTFRNSKGAVVKRDRLQYLAGFRPSPSLLDRLRIWRQKL